MNTKSEAEAVAELVTPKPQLIALPGHSELHTDKTQILMIPKGMEAKSIKPLLDEYLPRPERRKGSAVLRSLDSFIDHTNRFKDDNSAVFAHPGKMKDGKIVQAPQFTTVLNYHMATAAGEPRWGDHKSQYQFPISEQWEYWHNMDMEMMKQGDFAAFIEDRIADIISPENPDDSITHLKNTLECEFATPAELVTLSKGLTVRQDETVSNQVQLENGVTSVQYTTKHSDANGAPIKVKSAFVIAIPVFEGGAFFRIGVRLRYRLKAGEIFWFIQMYRTDRVFEHVFNDACQRVNKGTGLPMFTGSPE